MDYDDGEKETGKHAALLRPLKADTDGLEVGAKVEGNYRGSGHWYPGTIVAVGPDGTTFDVDYDDGEKETGKHAALLRPLKADTDGLEVGAKVEGNYRGSGHWYPGTIVAVGPDGTTFDVDYDDGEKETGKHAALLRPLKADTDGLEVGAKVEGNYRGSGHWYPGTIVAVGPDGTTFDVDYDDGEKETGKHAALLRPLKADTDGLEVGAKVEGNYRGSGHWYPGTIVAVGPDGTTFDVDYDDGEKETGKHAALLRPLKADTDGLEVGAKVEGNYRGSGHWYPGTIVAVGPDGTTFDVDYDDGEKETGKHAALLRLI